MVSFRHLTVALAALGLSACVSANDPATRGAPLAATLGTAGSQSSGEVMAAATPIAEAYDVEAIRIDVPRSLKVSEANTFKPHADIVWRGEALGDRYEQVKAIFADGIQAGTAGLQSGRKVDLDITVTRFHALTEKTRYTFGGMHEMQFILTVRDSATGEILQGPRKIVADVKASGGSAAIEEERQGRTQRIVTVERLAQVIRQELSVPAPAMVVSQLDTPAAAITE